jgi:hypothetical protein
MSLKPEHSARLRTQKDSVVVTYYPASRASTGESMRSSEEQVVWNVSLVAIDLL